MLEEPLVDFTEEAIVPEILNKPNVIKKKSTPSIYEDPLDEAISKQFEQMSKTEANSLKVSLFFVHVP